MFPGERPAADLTTISDDGECCQRQAASGFDLARGMPLADLFYTAVRGRRAIFFGSGNGF